MKLEEWGAQWDIIKINERLPVEYRWPNLDQLITALEQFKRVSTMRVGYGIFLGWRSAERGWIYHHGICLPSYLSLGASRYNFHSPYSMDNVADSLPIPTLNVGDLPESSAFLDVLESVGFVRPQPLEVMAYPKLVAR